MSDILAIETATDVCSVAVWIQGRLAAERETTIPRSHAEKLVPMMVNCLNEAGLDAAALDAIAVSAGPGSYTGLRIGTSTAKGLAFATGVPLYGIPTLQGLVYPLREQAQPGDTLCAALNSRKNEVYLACYTVNEAGALSCTREACALHHSEIQRVLEEVPSDRYWLTGEAADLLIDHEMLPASSAVVVASQSERSPSARSIAALAQERIMRDEPPEDIMSYEPAYLKPFVAKQPKQSKFDRLPF